MRGAIKVTWQASYFSDGDCKYEKQTSVNYNPWNFIWFINQYAYLNNYFYC